MAQSGQILPPPHLLNFHHWTNEEQAFKRKDLNGHWSIPLSLSLRYRLKNSLFGNFLEEFNLSQHQDSFLNCNKLEMLRYNLKKYTKHDLEVVKGKNRFLGDCLQLVQEAIGVEEVIQISFLESNLKTMFLDCSFVTDMDCTLLQFSNLLVLTLCGNYLKGVKGKWLPRRLEVLDLYHNLIEDLEDLVVQAPRCLKHLGLGRNLLQDSSSLHLLSHFRKLLNLDLSENNITDFKRLRLPQCLASLALLGNPGALPRSYLSTVLAFWPWLTYLDYTEVLEKDRVSKEAGEIPYISFKCYRVLGLPQPPKDRKNLQTFHLEVLFPLLSGLDEGVDVVEQPDNAGKFKKNYYSGANEYNKEEDNIWCKTDSVAWSKVMEFPAIQFSDPQNNLTHFRDTFRSIIPVRLIYLKTAPKPKKPKKTEYQSEENMAILKKLTIASFYCELSSPNWSEEYQDFYWADHPDVGVTARRVDGCLQALQYELDATPTKNKKKNKQEVEEGADKEALPRVLTCQVGFGVG